MLVLYFSWLSGSREVVSPEGQKAITELKVVKAKLADAERISVANKLRADEVSSMYKASGAQVAVETDRADREKTRADDAEAKAIRWEKDYRAAAIARDDALQRLKSPARQPTRFEDIDPTWNKWSNLQKALLRNEVRTTTYVQSYFGDPVEVERLDVIQKLYWKYPFGMLIFDGSGGSGVLRDMIVYSQ